MAVGFWSGRYRFLVLSVATGCLSMMLANILCLNFTILCMTEHKHNWHNFSVDLGIDVFQKVDFERGMPSTPEVPSPHQPSETPKRPKWPNVEIPDISAPSLLDFNWQTFELARHNPQLFIRLFKMVAMEAAKMAAKYAGEKVDPRNVDFGKLREGFNLTNFNEDVLAQLKMHLLRMVKERRAQINGQMNFSQIEEFNEQRKGLEDIELVNITWNGQLNGRLKIIEKAADHEYSQRQKAILFGIIAIGALLAIPGVGIGIDKFGCRKIFTIVALISALSTALCPLAAALGFIPFLLVRLVQGVGFAVCFPVIGAVTSAWACLKENGLFNGALTSFIQLAPVITMPLSGVICATIGWPLAYYFHSLITLGMTALWWIVYRDTPSEHQRVNIVELRVIQEGKVTNGRSKHNKKFPFKAICTDVSVWAIWVAAIGNMYAIQMMIMFSPTYIREILHYAILNVGFAAAIPTLMQFLVKMVAGISSDKMPLDETLKVRLFNSIAFCGMAAFMIALAFTPTRHYRLALVFIILCVTVLGFNTGGFFKSATLIGRQYAYFIGANIQVIMCISMLTVPLFVYSLTPNNSPDEWSNVFIAHAVLLLISNAIFCFIGSGKAAQFTQMEGNNNNEVEEEEAIPAVQTHSQIKTNGMEAVPIMEEEGKPINGISAEAIKGGEEHKDDGAIIGRNDHSIP